MIREAARGVLADPEALEWSDDYAGEDDLPDPAKLKAAAEKLAAERPWLARPRGPLPGQGVHSDSEAPLSLSQLLRG